MNEETNKNLSNLMQQQNKSLEQFVAERKSLVEGMLLPGEKIFVENLFRDEIRDGFVVTAHRKRLWNIQLNLLDEFDRICKKYNLRWFAYAGTLLGAVRHKGFVPWDDDLDICMLRPEYEKFKAVVKTEISQQYFVDAWYDYKLEDEEPDILQDKSCLQVVKREQRQKDSIWWPFWPMIKLKDNRTTFVQYLDRPHVHQGIFIDIFPFDSVPPFSDLQHKINFEIERELLFAITLPDVIKEALKENPPPLLFSPDEIKIFLKLNHREKALAFEAFALKNFSQSEFVGELRDHCLIKKNFSYALNDFKDVVYLPFEKTEICCPVGYDSCLRAKFGDWRKPVYTHSHTQIYSADFSYKDFFNSVKFV